MTKIVLLVSTLLFGFVGMANEKEVSTLDNLVKKFEANPADSQTTIQLLEELKRQGKSNISCSGILRLKKNRII